MIQKDKILETIFNILEQNQGQALDVYNQNFNYVEDSSFDSFALLEFITDVEQTFDITLSVNELQNHDNHLIGGLVEVIYLKQTNK
jgi:acyl carrier protein